MSAEAPGAWASHLSDARLQGLLRDSRRRANNARGPSAAQAADRMSRRYEAELRRRQEARAALPPMCHELCYDEDGHTDGCLYEDGLS